MPSIAIVGASPNRSKFGNKAVRAYAARGYKVYPVHPSAKEIEGIRAYPSVSAIPEPRLDRVSVYLPPEIGLQVIEEIATKPIGELWLNPGAESAALIARAEALGLTVVAACSIVDIGESPASYQ
jgi:predicted CoA-binding protein